MADLKTRKAVKGTVKTIDRAAVAAERLKSAAVRTKNAAQRYSCGDFFAGVRRSAAGAHGARDRLRVGRPIPEAGPPWFF